MNAEEAHAAQFVGIDPAPGGAIVTAHRGGNGVLYIDGVGAVSRDEFAAWVSSFTEKMRPLMEAMRTRFETLCATLRPLADLLTELHEQFPDPADWVLEPEPEGCHHLCGGMPEHECLGDADGTFAYREGGREIPMCAPCRAAAGGFATTARMATRLAAASRRADDLDTARRAEREVRIDYGDPIVPSDADWTARGDVCAHVCGGNADHACDARATTTLRYALPSGGTRDMPICEACHAAEMKEPA